MEGMTGRGCHGVRGYWKRKGYQKLNGRGSRRKPATEELEAAGGSTRNRRRFFWRIRLTHRLKLRFSPKRFMIALRDAYVNFMNKIANSRFASSGGLAGYAYAGAGVNGFGVRPLKEYDERMIIEIYKSLVVAQAQLVPARIPHPHPTPLATIAEC